jgi:hypothetical protein
MFEIVSNHKHNFMVILDFTNADSLLASLLMRISEDVLALKRLERLLIHSALQQTLF